MNEVQVNSKLTEKEFNRLVSSFQLDLIAYYNMMMEDIHEIIKQSAKENWTPEELLSKVDDMFSD